MDMEIVVIVAFVLLIFWGLIGEGPSTEERAKKEVFQARLENLKKAEETASILAEKGYPIEIINNVYDLAERQILMLKENDYEQ